jgi:hypothetical protein
MVSKLPFTFIFLRHLLGLRKPAAIISILSRFDGLYVHHQLTSRVSCELQVLLRSQDSEVKESHHQVSYLLCTTCTS